MGKKMNNAPVYFTLAQIRFNPVLKLEEYLPAIQDKFRSYHYSDYRPEQIQQITIPPQAQSMVPVVSSHSRYVFGNLKGNTNYILDESSLTLQTTDYETFVEFFSMFFKGLDIINEELGLDFIDRLGLRYLDAVLPQSSEKLSSYLQKEVMGMSEKSHGLSHSLSETVSVSDSYNLISRVLIRRGKLGLPSDILPLAPALSAKFSSFEGEHAIIDCDAYKEGRRQFQIDEIKNDLKGLHSKIEESFTMMVTEHAIQSWS